MDTHLLIVDDSKPVRDSLRELLGFVGGIERIEEAGSLGEALDRVRRSPPNLVILDLHLPDGLGSSIIQALKDLAPELPIAMFTCYGDPGSRQHCLDLGADWYFDKAMDLEGLVDVVNLQLGRPAPAAQLFFNFENSR